MTDVDIERLQAITLEPYDVIVVSVPDHVSLQEAEQVRGSVEVKFPGHQVIVKPVSVGIDVVRSEDVA